MKFPRLTEVLPSWKNAGLAILSAILLLLAFPDFEFWLLAWFGLAPLLWAVEREKESAARSFVLGWLWGFVFFTGTCWWLTFAPITYAGFPWPLAYFLLLCVTAAVGVFPGLFAFVTSVCLRRFGSIAILAAPFIWIFTEYARYWLTGNNWNGLGYAMAFTSGSRLQLASYGGVYLLSFYLLFWNVVIAYLLISGVRTTGAVSTKKLIPYFAYLLVGNFFFVVVSDSRDVESRESVATVVGIQPNVPMSGLNPEKWQQLRTKHLELAESALTTISEQRSTGTTVVFPESPMNFMYEEDEEFRNFVHAFAAKHDVQVLFNSAEPDAEQNKYFNSAVLVGPDGREIAQYDKIYLLPFGESVPTPLQSVVPAFVGSFSYGKEYDLLPLGDANAGVMICFESHFGELGREYVRNGADVLIEMTNDGYLGPTPVLRQHLANAVFRAVETNRPVLRATNVGITAFINERGVVIDATEGYIEDTRVWSVSKSDGLQTFYVRYGDWFALLCSIVSLILLGLSLRRPSRSSS